jgi:hypothetical protein
LAVSEEKKKLLPAANGDKATKEKIYVRYFNLRGNRARCARLSDSESVQLGGLDNLYRFCLADLARQTKTCYKGLSFEKGTLAPQ